MEVGCDVGSMTADGAKSTVAGVTEASVLVGSTDGRAVGVDEGGIEVEVTTGKTINCPPGKRAIHPELPRIMLMMIAIMLMMIATRAYFLSSGFMFYLSVPEWFSRPTSNFPSILQS
jgi:hypothetical protein